MRKEPKQGKCYKYIAVYVDNLPLAMLDPNSFIEILMKKYKFKLKGTGKIAYHLGIDFSRDSDGTLC